MKRHICTLLVSVGGFAAIVSFASPDARSEETSVHRAERGPYKTKTSLWSLPAEPDGRRIEAGRGVTTGKAEALPGGTSIADKTCAGLGCLRGGH
jgi:hypothetical protein